MCVLAEWVLDWAYIWPSLQGYSFDCEGLIFKPLSLVKQKSS